jgi:hypothetical protein
METIGLILSGQYMTSVATVVTDVFQINSFSMRNKIGKIAKLHLGGNERTPAWITTRLGITGAAIISDNAKLGLGSPIRLHDTALARRHDGFESPWLFGILDHILWHEPGYHVFAMKPHLFTITKDPYPIYCSVVHVAIANRFLASLSQVWDRGWRLG